MRWQCTQFLQHREAVLFRHYDIEEQQIGLIAVQIGDCLVSRPEAIDAAWLTDLEAGLEDELAAGIGVAGTFIGPWETIIRANVGTALTGPDSGVNAFITVLKLLKPGRGGKRAQRAASGG